MNKKIENYIHLYPGCGVTYDDVYYGKTGIVGVITPKIIEWALYPMVYGKNLANVKPHLRTVSSMMEEEMKELWKFIFKKPFHVNGNIRFIEQRTTLTEPRWVLSSGVERLGIEVSGNVWYDSDLQNYKFNQHEVTLWLLSKHFDLFGLIDSGLAIDKTKL